MPALGPGYAAGAIAGMTGIIAHPDGEQERQQRGQRVGRVLLGEEMAGDRRRRRSTSVHQARQTSSGVAALVSR